MRQKFEGLISGKGIALIAVAMLSVNLLEACNAAEQVAGQVQLSGVQQRNDMIWQIMGEYLVEARRNLTKQIEQIQNSEVAAKRSYYTRRKISLEGKLAFLNLRPKDLVQEVGKKDLTVVMGEIYKNLAGGALDWEDGLDYKNIESFVNQLQAAENISSYGKLFCIVGMYIISVAYGKNGSKKIASFLREIAKKIPGFTISASWGGKRATSPLAVEMVVEE